MNLCVTKRARLELSGLVMKRGRAGRIRKRRRMARQAQEVDVAQFQKVRIGRAVRRVARLATLDFHYLVLEDKRSLFVRVALKAREVLRGRTAQLVRPDSAMRIMTVSALDEPLIHAVVERHFKLRSFLKMAGVTELRLALHEKKLLDGGMMGRMAVDTTHLVAGMLRAQGIGMLGVFCVAIEAALIHFFGCRFIEAEDFCGVGGIGNMGRTRSVTGFTAVTGNMIFL